MTLRETLIDQYRQLHATKPYGRSSEFQLGFIQRHLDRLGPIRTIADYGCGQSRLVDWLAKLHDAQAMRFDPAMPAYTTPLEGPCDLVICTDVMEHVPEVEVDAVLADIRRLSPAAFFNISLRPAKTYLPNGDNAHCTVRPQSWWEDRLHPLFPHLTSVRSFTDSSASFITF